MPLTLEQLREGARSLPVDQRIDLADFLYESVDTNETSPSFELHPDWRPELERRSEELRSGKVKGIPAEDVFREIDDLIDGL